MIETQLFDVTRLLDESGYVKCAPKQIRNQTYGTGNYIKRDNRKKAKVCLNCEKVSCEKGYCEIFKKGSV